MVDHDMFLDWAESRLGEVRVHGDEIQVNSIFDPDGDDQKHKLWCNPHGGKYRREHGVFHCWISGRTGTLARLVMEVDRCSFESACEAIGLDDDVSRMEDRLDEFFASPGRPPAAEPEPEAARKVTLPEGSEPILKMPGWSNLRARALSHLAARRVPPDGLYACWYADYRDRIIIPYYDRDGSLVYFNGRYVGDHPKAPRYLGPPKDIGVGKGDVVYMPRWPEPGVTLMVTEGEFDAMVLSQCGFHSCSVGGSHLTDHQRRVLRGYRVCLCGDVDKPGAGAVFRTGTRMLEEGFRGLTFVRPPKGFKDWNEFYAKFRPEVVAEYVRRKVKPFDAITAEQLFAENV